MGCGPETRQIGIYWLASYPRSGNTWVRMFLRAYITGNCDINADNEVILGMHDHLAWQASSAAPIQYLGFLDRIDYMSAAMKNFTFLKGKDVRLKTHDANASMGSRNIIPHQLTRGAVYLVRDPRDVAVSVADYKGCSIDAAIDEMANEDTKIGNMHSYDWQFLGSWSMHVKSWMGPTAPAGTIAIRYEKLQQEPLKCFRAIIEGLGLPDKGDAEIMRAVEMTRFKKLKQQEQEKGFHESHHKGESFFRRGKVGSWKEELKPDQVERIESDHGEMMETLGYEIGVKA